MALAGPAAAAARPGRRPAGAPAEARRRRDAGDGPTAARPAAHRPSRREPWPRSKREPGPFLLFGATGSGKTEVYLQAVQRLLARDPQAQALVMVPEINLTPQLQERFVARFGAGSVVAMNSGMTPAAAPEKLAGRAQRRRAHRAGHAHGGVRIACPRLQLIVVDEEHDPSYKQQEGARYSARDLAVYRGRLEGAKVLLGSATPSLESWQAARRAATGGW